jgi:hypothetical protein
MKKASCRGMTRVIKATKKKPDRPPRSGGSFLSPFPRVPARAAAWQTDLMRLPGRRVFPRGKRSNL